MFLDDNPAERELVRNNLNGIAVPEIGSVSDYIRIVDRSGFFESTVISEDDQKRNAMFKENLLRRNEMQQYVDYQDYLKSLNMIASIDTFRPEYYARITQLCNKTNQFNLTTKRYTQAEIEELSVRKDYITLYSTLTDKFGDNGIVSLIIGHIDGTACHIELFLMSCRVFKRDLEYAVMDAFSDECKGRGVHKLFGYYYPSPKNQLVEFLYQKMGFSLVENNNEYNKWMIELDQYQQLNDVINIERGQV